MLPIILEAAWTKVWSDSTTAGGAKHKPGVALGVAGALKYFPVPASIAYCWSESGTKKETTMDGNGSSRRSFLKQVGAAGAMALAATGSGASALPGSPTPSAEGQSSPLQAKMAATRA